MNEKEQITVRVGKPASTNSKDLYEYELENLGRLKFDTMTEAKMYYRDHITLADRLWHSVRKYIVKRHYSIQDIPHSYSETDQQMIGHYHEKSDNKSGRTEVLIDRLENGLYVLTEAALRSIRAWNIYDCDYIIHEESGIIHRTGKMNGFEMAAKKKLMAVPKPCYIDHLRRALGKLATEQLGTTGMPESEDNIKQKADIDAWISSFSFITPDPKEFQK